MNRIQRARGQISRTAQKGATTTPTKTIMKEALTLPHIMIMITEWIALLKESASLKKGDMRMAILLEMEEGTEKLAGVMIRSVGIMIMGVGTMRLTVEKLGMGMVNNFRDLRRIQRTLIPVMRRLK